MHLRVGELKENEGDIIAAINLYLKGNIPAKAARLIMKSLPSKASVPNPSLLNNNNNNNGNTTSVSASSSSSSTSSLVSSSSTSSLVSSSSSSSSSQANGSSGRSNVMFEPALLEQVRLSLSLCISLYLSCFSCISEHFEMFFPIEFNLSLSQCVEG